MFDSHVGGGNKTLLLGFALLVIALAATGCEQPDKGPVAVDSITINKLETNAIGFEAGKTFKLTADIQPDNATDKTVVWSSSDENVATVSDDGTVTIKKEGNVTIKAEAGGKSTSDTFVFYKGEDPGYYFNETENTYYIWNATGLLAWNAYVTTYTSTTTAHICTSAKLMADISLEGKSWTPVGCFGAAEGELVEYFYAGTFDGGGHIISNLKIDSSDSYSSYLGLFAYIAPDGVVKDLTLSDVAISGNSYIGGIAGYNYGTIENCSVSGSVSGNIGVGGIAGQNNGTISNCNNEGKVSGAEAESIGGIVGYNRGTIEYCDVESGSVSGASDVGGIAGFNLETIENCSVSVSVLGIYEVGGIAGCNYGTISGCNNEGNVSETEKGSVGGIAGYSYGTISVCYNIGEISGTSSVGGIAGVNSCINTEGIIISCYNTGDVYSESGDYIGGIAGGNSGEITACYNTGSVSGASYIGGIAGENNGTITACYNTGDVSGSSDIGGIVGYNWNTVSACYNIGEISGTDSVGGIAGANDWTITACYNTGSVSGNEGVGGIAGNNNGTITACYWSVPEESSATSGIGDDQVSDPTTKVDGTWDDALSGMNEALGIESEYSYKENDDSTTKETMPLIIVKKSSN